MGRHVRWHHHVPRYCRQNAEGDHRSCPLHHQDQDHRSPREEVLRLDRRIHPGLPLHLPACGSPSRSTTSAAPPSSTASASKCLVLILTMDFNLFSNIKHSSEEIN